MCNDLKHLEDKQTPEELENDLIIYYQVLNLNSPSIRDGIDVDDYVQVGLCDLGIYTVRTTYLQLNFNAKKLDNDLDL